MAVLGFSYAHQRPLKSGRLVRARNEELIRSISSTIKYCDESNRRIEALNTWMREQGYEDKLDKALRKNEKRTRIKKIFR